MQPHRAAFGPGDAGQPAGLARVALGADRPRERWLAAVALGGCGHYAVAATALRRLWVGPEPLFQALAGATLAAHLRQLGGHEQARPWDGAALAASELLSRAPRRLDPDPDGADAVGARVDALLGLAADALGLGRVRTARRLHARAIEAAQDADPATRSWRVVVRLGWVDAEIALGENRPDTAVGAASRALQVAREAGSERHVLKSGLVLGAAEATAGRSDAAARRLDGVVTRARSSRYTSLVWPAEVLLAELRPASAEEHRQLARTAFGEVLLRTDRRVATVALRSRWVASWLVQSGGSGHSDEPSRFAAVDRTAVQSCQVLVPGDR